MVQDLESHSKLLNICNPCRTTFNMLQRQTDNTGQMTALGRVMLILVSLKSPASTPRTTFHHIFSNNQKSNITSYLSLGIGVSFGEGVGPE